MYTQLNRSAREIRLLEIRPSEQPSEQLQCQLSIVSLDDRPDYEVRDLALSYCWGQGTHPVPIVVNGNERAIGTNLFIALQRLRDTHTPMVLWIDSLCIDQCNNEEKAHQISLMREIYRSSSQVIVWLGAHSLYEKTWKIIEELRPLDQASFVDWDFIYHQYPEVLSDADKYITAGNDPFVLGFKTLYLLATDTHITEMPHFPESHFTEQVSEEDMKRAQVLSALPGMTGGLLCLDQFASWSSACAALLLVLSRAYWTRVWIIQEIVLGEKDPLIYFGRHSVPFSIFVAAERNLSKHYHGCCAAWGRDALGAEWSKVTSLLEELAIARHLARLREIVGAGSVMSLADVMRILDVHTERDATDPRDQIYGVLGLVNTTQSNKLVPRYGLSIAEVYADATFRMIADTGNLSPLVRAERQRHESLNLPSWVPDWSVTSSFGPEPFGWELFDALPGKMSNCNLTDGSVLSVKGVVVDTIKWTGRRMVSEHQRVGDLLMRLGEWRLGMSVDGGDRAMNSLEEFLGFEYNQDSPIASSANAVFWATILGGSLLTEENDNRRLGSDDFRSLSQWWEWFCASCKNGTLSKDEEWAGIRTKIPLEYQDIFRTLRERTRLRKCFATENSRYGMGLSIIKDGIFGTEDVVTDIQTGDLVCLLEGSRLPVVLRRHRPSAEINDATVSTIAQPQYSYLGTCFIHGMMDGEVVSSAIELVDIAIGNFEHRKPKFRPKDRCGQPVGFSNLPGPLQNLIAEVHGCGSRTKKGRGEDYQTTALRRFPENPNSDEASGSSSLEITHKQPLMGKALFAELKASGVFTERKENEG